MTRPLTIENEPPPLLINMRQSQNDLEKLGLLTRLP